MVNFTVNSSDEIFSAVKRVRKKPNIKALPDKKQEIFINLSRLNGAAYQKELKKVKLI